MTAIGNWSGTVRTLPAVVRTPKNVQDVVEIVQDKAACPSPVRPMGNFHSTTRCAEADAGTLIDMTRLNRVLEIGEEFVRVEAGAIYIDVADELARHGKAFFVSLEIGNATLGSIASCATKDGAFPGEFGQAGAYVTALRIVSARGEVVEIDESNAGLLAAFRSSYGLLGVVVEVTVRIRPLKPIAVRHENLSLEAFLKRLPELKSRNGSLAFYLFPFADRVTVQLRAPATPDRRLNRIVWRLRNFGVAFGIPISARAIRLLPWRRLRYRLLDVMLASARGLLSGLLHARNTLPTDQITRYAHRPRFTRFTFSIFAFPEDRYPDVVRAYASFCREYFQRHGYRPDLLTVGYRVTQSRHALLSYSWDGDVMTIDPVALGGPEWERFAAAFSQFAIAHGGQPLLNQTPLLDAGQLRQAFGERLDEFLAWRGQLDPEARFLNTHFRDLLDIVLDPPVPDADPSG